MPVRIAELNLFPGKGMAPDESADRLEIGPDGLFGDREYMWVEAESHVYDLHQRGKVVERGHYLSTRNDPILTQATLHLEPEGGATLGTRGGGNGLYVPPAEDAPANRMLVSVHSWRGQGVDQGDEAAEWGRELVGRPVRLVGVSNQAPRWVEDNPSLGRVGFSDGYPVTVASTDSRDQVNSWLARAGEAPITGRRPRTTLVLSGLVLPNRAELPAGVFPEDFVEEIRIGSGGLVAVLRRMKACGRCPVPDTNELTGERKGSPVRKALGALARNGHHEDSERYGAGPELFWSQNYIIELPEGMGGNDRIEVGLGDEVEVSYSSTANWNRRSS